MEAQSPPPAPPPPPAAPPPGNDYPGNLHIEYPDRPLNRLTTFFRFFASIPIWIVLGTVAGGTYNLHTGGSDAAVTTAGAGGALVAGPALMIIFRQKYPR